MLQSDLTTVLLVLLPALGVYAYLLNRRLVGPHPLARTHTPPPKSEWDQLGDYSSVDMRKHIGKATQRGYVVIGGCGMTGSWVARLLMLRGENHVRVADVVPPPADLAGREGLECVRVDITSGAAVDELLTKPFPDGVLPSVVIHTASLIRFWERRAYLASVSNKVNIGGTTNLLEASKRIPSINTFIYTSSAAVSNWKGLFMRLGSNLKSNSDLLAREDIEGDQDHHYPRTKKAADKMVRQADGNGGLRTGVLRPGMSILGVGDLFGWSYLSVCYASEPPPTIPAFGGDYSQHSVNSQDLAAAHLLLADALQNPEKADKAGGEAFMVTGDPAWYDFTVNREIIGHYSRRRLSFVPIMPLIVYVVGHLLEIVLLIRWYLFKPFYGAKLRPTPGGLGLAEGLQPSMFETALMDVFVDDSKIRNVLGYRNAWNTFQSLRWVVDEFEKTHVPPVKGQKSELRPWGTGHSDKASTQTVAAEALEVAREKVA